MGTDNAVNLASHRSAQSVWDRRGWSGVTIEERVAPWAIALGGVAMMAHGATRRSLGGVSLMLGGAGLIACSALGLCNPRDARMRWRQYVRTPASDRVTDESIDSFPASDAPSSNATVVSAAR